MNLRIFTVIIFYVMLMTASTSAVSQPAFDSTVALINSGQYELAWNRISVIYEQDSLDPEYYVLAVNYYFMKSAEEYIEILTTPPDTPVQYLELADSSGKISQYLISKIKYDIDSISIGLSILKRGLIFHPNRLDMHFGLVHVSETVGLYSELTSALLTILAHSKKNNNEWLWSFSETLADEPIEFIRENVQSRVRLLFQLKSQSSDSMVLKISEAMIETFPTSSYGYTNLGVLYELWDENGKALNFFLDAAVVDSADGVVILNLAKLFEKLERVDKAIIKYQLLIKYGNEIQADYSRKQLKRLGVEE